jgi:hypothetical protein
MKKKISGKLTLGKRSVATLSEELMSQVNGGYSEGCGSGGGSAGCTVTVSCQSCYCSRTYAAYTQPRCC